VRQSESPVSARREEPVRELKSALAERLYHQEPMFRVQKERTGRESGKGTLEKVDQSARWEHSQTAEWALMVYRELKLNQKMEKASQLEPVLVYRCPSEALSPKA